MIIQTAILQATFSPELQALFTRIATDSESAGELVQGPLPYSPGIHVGLVGTRWGSTCNGSSWGDDGGA